MTAPSLADGVSEGWPQSHASDTGWLCIPSVHAPSDAHQDGQRAERVDVRRREAIAWPGAICIRIDRRVVVAVLNNLGISMETPTTDIGNRLPSVPVFRPASCNGKAHISHNLHHRRRHSAASLACTPSFRLMLHSLRRPPLKRAWCATVAGGQTPASPTRR